MKQKTRVKMPCGYEAETEIEMSFFDFGKLDINGLPLCPLHGKECKREVQ